MDLHGLQYDVANSRRLAGSHALKETNNEGLNMDDVWAAVVANFISGAKARRSAIVFSLSVILPQEVDFFSGPVFGVCSS
jgi:hypothetical protein